MDNPITDRLSQLDKRLNKLNTKGMKGGNLWDDIKDQARKGVQTSAQFIEDRFGKKGGKTNEDQYIFKNVAKDLIKSSKLGGKKVKSSVKVTKARKNMYYEKPLSSSDEDGGVTSSDDDIVSDCEGNDEMHILPYYDMYAKPHHLPELNELIGMKMKGKGNIKWDDIIRII